MQGRHHYQHKVVHECDLEALIPAHHFLRRVDQEVSFEFIRQRTAPYYCSHNGRPSIDPEVFFRMVLVGYLYNKVPWFDKSTNSGLFNCERAEYQAPRALFYFILAELLVLSRESGSESVDLRSYFYTTSYW